MTTSSSSAAFADARDDKIQEFWQATAEDYDAWIASDFEDQYAVNWEILSRYVHPAHRVLDVGCGPGSLSIRLARQCREVCGVDVTPEMIRVAQEKLTDAAENVSFHEGDACALPFESHSFDTVMSVNALQTMDQPDAAVAEMRRVLRPGGELLLIAYCYGDSSLFENTALMQWAAKYGGNVQWHSFTFEQLAALLPAKGFEVVEAQKIWEGPVVAFLRGRATAS
jgi:ubiquinone/menaquinone biosynthesis C-methylase UbiE